MSNSTSSIHIWESVNIKILDVRRKGVTLEDKITSYPLPANSFIFTTGAVRLQLDDIPYQTRQFSIFHGNKGTKLSLLLQEEPLEYFMILYKPGNIQKDRFSTIPDTEENPFLQKFGLTPGNSIFFLEQLKRMHTQWQMGSPLEHIYVKGAFYQIVYEIYTVLSKESKLCPDIVLSCLVYMEKHYHEVISIQSLADSLNVSYSHLIRTFKKKMGQSPQACLTDIKIKAACNYLRDTDIPVKDISSSCGFYDEYHFSNLFKKHMGVSPVNYRKKVTSNTICTSIAVGNPISYNEKRLEQFNPTYNKGDFAMMKKMKQHAAFAAALSIVLLMTGCSKPADEITNPTEISVPPVTESATGNQKEADTKTIQTLMGEVDVPVNPERIVIAFFQGDMLKLGITPVGTSFNDDAVFEELLSETDIVDPWGLDAEQVMSLEPDLIIWNNPDEYETLSKIAPTVVMDYYSMSVDQRVTFFGELLGREEQASAAIKEFHAKVDAGIKTLADNNLSDKTIILFENQTAGVLRVFGDNYGRGGELIYQYLGLMAPQRILDEVINNAEVNFVDISYEVLPEYEADFIFSDEMIVALEGNEVWESLTAVKEGRLIQTNSGMFWFSDITSMNAQLDFILESLLKTS